MMEIFNLTQIITDPTREAQDSSTLIDQIYVNHPKLYSSRDVLPIGLSDHHLVYSVRKKFKNEQKLDHVYAKYRDQNKLSANDFINDLKAVDWNSLRSLSEIDSMCLSARCLCLWSIRSDSEKWINDDILSEVRQRDILHRRALKSRDNSDWVLLYTKLQETE